MSDCQKGQARETNKRRRSPEEKLLTPDQFQVDKHFVPAEHKGQFRKMHLVCNSQLACSLLPRKGLPRKISPSTLPLSRVAQDENNMFDAEIYCHLGTKCRYSSGPEVRDNEKARMC